MTKDAPPTTLADLAAPPDEGAELLADVQRFLCRFVAFPSDAAAIAVALWVLHSHLLDAFESTPRLALLSPEPGSGKTRALEVLDLLVPEPMPVLSASPAAIFRSIEANRPTLLFDEVDTVFARRGKDNPNEDLRGLLNAGHRRGATIPRCVGPQHQVAKFPVYCAVALAGLGDLPDTLMSRSVIIRMRRRAQHESVEPFRHRIHSAEGAELCKRVAEWADSVRIPIEGAFPEMPPGVTDRPADCWEPLLAVADAVGGGWPTAAREACVELVEVAEKREASLGVRLLADLRLVFTVRDANGEPTGDVKRAMSTEAILEALYDMPEAPWSELRGKPIGDRGLARILGKYGITPTQVKIGKQNQRGYRGEDLWDSWARYLPADPRG